MLEEHKKCGWVCVLCVCCIELGYKQVTYRVMWYLYAVIDISWVFRLKFIFHEFKIFIIIFIFNAEDYYCEKNLQIDVGQFARKCLLRGRNQNKEQYCGTRTVIHKKLIFDFFRIFLFEMQNRKPSRVDIIW